MRRHAFQAFGILVLAFDAPFILSAPAWRSYWTPQQQLRGFVVVGVLFLIGLGLLYLRKWAALYFSVPLFWVGLTWAVIAVEEVAFPCNLFWMAHGISLMLPLYVTIKIWSRLSWGSKWFF